ncbi:MAG: hypothetical protein ACFCBV_08285 [Phycisphaerales bacterium]
MRRRFEAKPPRRPRVLSPRLVLVSLVVGVVLAAGSVFMGAAYAWSGTRTPDAPGSVDRYFHEATTSLYSARRGWMWTRWVGLRFPGPGGQRVILYAESRGVEPIDRSPLPPRARILPARDWRRVDVLHAGWPWRAAFGMAQDTTWSGRTPSVGLWRVRATGIDWTVPFLPSWPGLLANTLFYTAVALMPLGLRRWIGLRLRARRGLCLACAYELGEGIGACPECGLVRAIS